VLGDRRPDLIVRFGYAGAMPFSLRRPTPARAGMITPDLRKPPCAGKP